MFGAGEGDNNNNCESDGISLEEIVGSVGLAMFGAGEGGNNNVEAENTSPLEE